MDERYTDAQFEALSWHDCHIWALDFQVGDADEHDWTSDLTLDIDFIEEWVCGVSGGARFRVAPASLTFHGVTDPRIHIDSGDSGFRTAIHLVSIDRIERTRVTDQQVFLDRPYYRWNIRLNWPAGGEISFGSVGFTQKRLAEPVLTDRQHLSAKDRSRLLRSRLRSEPT